MIATAPADMLTNLAAWIWKSSWQAGVIALVILLIQRFLGRRLGAISSYSLWVLVAIRLLMPVGPRSHISIYNIAPAAQEMVDFRLRSALGFQGDDTAVPEPASVTTKPETPAVKVESAPVLHRSIPWRTVISATWLAGAAWMLMRLAFGTYRFRRAISRSRRAPSPELLQLATEAAAALRMRQPAVVQTSVVDSPAVTGLWSPLVVLPMDLEQRFTHEEIRFLLLHEFAHIRRGDLWAELLAGNLRVVHWFNPILRYAFLCMRHDREAACDASVLRTQQPEARITYGETLIKALENLASMTRPAGVLGILESHAQLRKRLLRIAGYARPTTLAMVTGALLLATLSATLLTRAEIPQPPATTEAVPPKTYAQRLLATARAGDRSLIPKIVEESYHAAPTLDQTSAGHLLDSLIESRECDAFKVLHGELRKTPLGKDWQPNDELLAGLVKDARKDYLEVLLAERLDLKRLRAFQKSAEPEMAQWIEQRTGEVERERGDIQKLVQACAKGDTGTVKLLLDAGVKVNGRTSDGNSWTPLTRAAAADKVDIVRILLERGAEVDLPKFPGWDYTPLCLTKSVEIANVLKAAGANVHATLYGRNTSILTYVVNFNGAPMVQWFLDQGLDPKMIGDNDQTLLFGAKDGETVKILLKAGVDPNRPDAGGRPPITEASSAGAAEALITAGARLTGTKRPLVQEMIQFGSSDAIEAVIKAGAQHDKKTLQNALISAVHMGYADTAKVLLKCGANGNEPGEWSGPNDKVLPLLVCAVSGSDETAKVLLAHGADPNAGDMPGQILENALANNHKKVAEMLKAAGAKTSSKLAYALGVGDEKLIGESLAGAPSYSEQPMFWKSVMTRAAERGNLEAMKAALRAGVPVIEVKGNIESSGYMSAAREGQVEVLQFLLQQRKVNNDPNELIGALWSAIENSHPYNTQRPTADFEKCVSLLLAAGTPVQGSLLRTAVFTRNPGGNVRVIEMLVAAGADPNPATEKGRHLSDEIADTCRTQGCSTPSEEVVLTLERLGRIKIPRDTGAPK